MTARVLRTIRSGIAMLALPAAGLSVVAIPAAAQVREPVVDVERQTAASTARLKGRIEETWRVVPLQDGLLLVPRRPIGTIKGVEIGASRLAIDGEPVTGGELVQRLGPAAEPVLQLSYLEPGERERLFAPPAAREAGGVREPAPADTPTGRARGRAREVPEQVVTRIPAGARVRIGGPVVVAEGEHVQDVVAVFGDVEMNGIADGNVVAVAGDVRLGPKAIVRGDVAAIAGRLSGVDRGRVSGTVTEVGWGFPDFRVLIDDHERVVVEVWPDWPRIARAQWLAALAFTALVVILTVFTAAIAPGAVRRTRVDSRPALLAWFLGLGAQILFLPALLVIVSVLTVTIVGIPLIAAVPLLVIGFFAAGLVGFTAVAIRMGGALLPGAASDRAPLLVLVPGLLLVLAIGVIGRYLLLLGPSPLGFMLAILGAFIEHTVWTIGLGAVVLTWIRRRQAAVIAPEPQLPPIAATL